MLEHEPECENQFAVKNRVVVAEREREGDHEESCNHGGEKSKLEDAPEKRTFCGAAPEKGEDEGRHAEIGDGAEDGVVGLEQPEMPVRGGSKVTRNKILDKK